MNMSTYSTIVFDLDGTLIDTLEDIMAAVEKVLVQIGKGRADGRPVFTKEEYRQMVGYGARRLIETATGLTGEAVDAILKQYSATYLADCVGRSCLYDGIKEMLLEMKRRQYTLLVVTNKPQPQADKILAHYFGDHFFDGVFGACPLYPPKPDPASTLLALQSVGADVQSACFMGDSDVDVFTAHRAGLPCVGVAWGFRGEQELRRAGADRVIQHPSAFWTD